MKTKGALTVTELRVDRELMNASSENETSCDCPLATSASDDLDSSTWNCVKRMDCRSHPCPRARGRPSAVVPPRTLGPCVNLRCPYCGLATNRPPEISRVPTRTCRRNAYSMNFAEPSKQQQS